MSLVVSSIGTYTNATGDLVSAKVLSLNTLAAGVTLMPNVKYKEKLSFLDTELNLQCADCNPTASGFTTITDKDITVDSVMISEKLCPEDMNKTYMQLKMKPGWNDSLPFEAQYVELKAAKFAAAIETNIWQQHSGATCKTAGLIDQIAADSDVVSGGTISGATASAFITALFTAIDLIPSAVASDSNLTLFIDPKKSNKMIMQLILNGNFVGSAEVSKLVQDQTTPWTIPGTNVKVVPVNGLIGTGYAYLTPAWNIVYAFDVENEYKQLDIHWSRDTQQVIVNGHMKFGVGYYFGAYIVDFVIV